jgi:serine/threonine-protein kinase
MLGGKYRVERILGQGGMGVVVEATHVGLLQRVAIKFLRSETKSIPGALDRFVREARAAAGIRTEHVVRVFDTGVFETGEPYIVMELLAGEDLRTLLMRRGTLTPTEAASFVVAACEALSQAHALGIVHRDLKPANLFVASRADGTPQLKVLDFGISKVYGDAGAQTSINVALGSPLYMSPEQIQTPRDVDARTDVWSLGVVLYEALVGQPPFEGEGMVGLATAIITGAPRPVPTSVPGELAAIVRRCLEKDRNARFPSAADLAMALRPYADAEAKLIADRIARAETPRIRSVPPPSSRDAPPISGFEATIARSGSMRRIPRHAEIAVSIGVLLCIAGGVGFVWSLRTKHSETTKAAAPSATTTASASAPEVTVEPSVSALSTAPVVSAPPAHPGATPVVHVTHPTGAATTTQQPPPPSTHVDLSGALRDRK